MLRFLPLFLEEFSHKILSENEFELIFTANIDEGWYIYSQSLADDGTCSN